MNVNASWFVEMARLILLILTSVLQISIICCQRSLDLEMVREWKQLEFYFPDGAKADAIQKKQFIVGNNVPIDVDVDYQGK